MNEEFATRPQIRTWYSVVRKCGIDPKEHAQKIKAKKGVASLNEITKEDMSKMITEYTRHLYRSKTPAQNPGENQNQNQNQNQKLKGKTEVVEAPDLKRGRKKEVVLALEEELNEVDAIFSECLSRATNMVSKVMVALPEKNQDTIILEVAKIYFEEVVHKRGKGVERG